MLEIGPGIGTLTQYLAEAARRVAAVEIDRNLIPILQETLAEYSKCVHTEPGYFKDRYRGAGPGV